MSKRNKAPSPAQSGETEDKADDQEAAPFVPPGPVDEMATADEPSDETDQAAETGDAEENDPAGAPEGATEGQDADPASEADKPADEAASDTEEPNKAPKVKKKRKTAKKKPQEKPPASADQQEEPLFEGPTCPRCKSQDVRPAPGFKPTKVTPKGEDKPITVQTGECRTCAQRFSVRVDDEATDD